MGMTGLRRMAGVLAKPRHANAGLVLSRYDLRMPVYFVTCHAYRSWSEANPRGYVQRDEGLLPPSEKLARWRAEHAEQPPTRFDDAQKMLLLDVVEELAEEDALQLYGTSCTATHLHMVIGFEAPPCQCPRSQAAEAEHCLAGCAARARADDWATRVKRIGGFRLAEAADVRGRKWFGRGWDVTPVRGVAHFRHVVREYLPKHRGEGGMVRVYAVKKKAAEAAPHWHDGA